MEGVFYPNLVQEKHGNFAHHYHRFENAGYNFGKVHKLDGAAVDVYSDSLQPMHISLDRNRFIVARLLANKRVRHPESRMIKGIHSLYPQKLNETLESLISYYRHRLKKVVYFGFDHTATAEY